MGAEIAERGDHGGVVGAELDGRVLDVDRQGLAQLAAQFLVGGDTAGDDDGGRLEIVIGFFSLIDQGFNGSVLETGCHIIPQFVVY